MKLEKLLKSVKVKDIKGNTSVDIKAIEYDSRKVKDGSMFVAIKGTATDGHNYIMKAVEAGAVAVVCERNPFVLPVTVTVIYVEDSADALGKMASEFYGNPSHNLKVVGVTGTNGKTTIASLLYELFENAGYKCGLLSTVENKVHGKIYPATHTTPDPVAIQSLMAEMVSEGCEYCFMEVSSHAVVQKRISGIEFNGGIFTNLTHDHLDYHKTFKNYRDAKKMFFDGLSENAFALSNLDDKNGTYMLQNTSAKRYYYSLNKSADFTARIIEMDFHGSLLNINGKEVYVKLFGEFNIYNILAIYGAAVLSGLDEERALLEISKLTPVRGRMEAIRSIDGKTFIIDYAHTPDALKNILETLNELKTTGRTIITVFGAGGDRDKTKRPEMGKIVASLSDVVIITSDNPRNEDPQKIIDDIKSGITSEKDEGKTLMIPDRAVAIRTSVLISKPGDIILIAGKGHEEYQEINGVKHHFSDREEVLKNITILK
jgi:UDP-N-acetylmuramoyl-L-alanyl-D-glutamate--2,6-diaminopimelate ligase